MKPRLSFDPALDQPRTLDYDELEGGERFRLSNPELSFLGDGDCDLFELLGSWQKRPYAQSIRVRISAPSYTGSGLSTEPEDALIPMALRFFPGYQETIFGSDGVIVSKRLFAPLSSGYDRSALWLLEAQAEGTRLVRIEVEIEWGEILDQRMVDGLLVAQSEPGEESGLHGQRDAESTRVFGASEGRPDYYNLFDGSRAYLIYHLLVTGQVDLPLILTLSDVGEQVAWNGFLAQRDISRVFKLSRDAWNSVSYLGRLWTPFAPLNQAHQQGKEEAVSQLVRRRMGLMPLGGEIGQIPTLIDAVDCFDIARSRELLDTMQRIAERTIGRIPADASDLESDSSEDRIGGNSAYLIVLARHIERHPSDSYLAQHADAIGLCAARLMESGGINRGSGLEAASRLAFAQGDEINGERWYGRSLELEEGEVAGAAGQDGSIADLAAGSPLDAAASLWDLFGVSRSGEMRRIAPRLPDEWGWWALLHLPGPESGLSLFWDGERLYATAPVDFDGEVEIVDSIRAEGSGEFDFNLRFRVGERRFRPVFHTKESWAAGESIHGAWESK